MNEDPNYMNEWIEKKKSMDGYRTYLLIIAYTITRSTYIYLPVRFGWDGVLYFSFSFGGACLFN